MAVPETKWQMFWLRNRGILAWLTAMAIVTTVIIVFVDRAVRVNGREAELKRDAWLETHAPEAVVSCFRPVQSALDCTVTCPAWVEPKRIMCSSLGCSLSEP